MNENTTQRLSPSPADGNPDAGTAAIAVLFGFAETFVGTPVLMVLGAGIALTRNLLF